jgi:hypothetical protein
MDYYQELVEHMLRGENYRVYAEERTLDILCKKNRWLRTCVGESRHAYGDAWRQGMFQELINKKRQSPEDKLLLRCLLGISIKGKTNLGYTKRTYPERLTRICKIDESEWEDVMIGFLSQQVRGSQKSFNGKTLEPLVLRTMLSRLGLKEGKDFWTRTAHTKTEREIDGKILTHNGKKIHIEIGLISAGNPEIVSDKINRIRKGDILLIDEYGKRSNVKNEADKRGRILIQLRGGNALQELYECLRGRVSVPLVKPPTTKQTNVIL